MSSAEPLIVVLEGPRAGHYREIASSILAAEAELAYVDCSRDVPVEHRARELDALLPRAVAVVSTPWLGGTAPGLELPTFDERRWSLASSLQAIAGTFDFRLSWINPEEAARRGVTLSDTSRTMTPTVAEFGLAMTLNALRCIPEQLDVVRKGGWITSPPDGAHYVYGDLSGRRVRLAGYGSINRHYRRFLRPFGCDVKAHDPFVDPGALVADDVTPTPTLLELAADAEIFVVAIPPTPKTMGAISAKVIDALPRGALFLLLSRMAVVDQDTLWRRVREGGLRAAIDVFDPEPPPADAWFRTASNVLPTPHIAGNAVYAHRRCFLEACHEAVRGLRGEATLHPATMRDKELYAGVLADRDIDLVGDTDSAD